MTMQILGGLGNLPPLPLALFSINSMGLRYGASKLCQILMPLLGYILIRDLLIQGFLLQQPATQKLLQRLQQWPAVQRWQGDFPKIFEQTLGLLSWKIGCDLGFFLIVDALGPWERAFTWSGLLPYTVIQYFLYYLVGRRMVIEGALNPFQARPITPPPRQRPNLAKRLLSKYFHEDVNVTSSYTPLRQVFLKPVVDYGGLVASWSFYTVGLFYAQTGQVTLEPLVGFSFFSMFTFYVVNTYGYILGFNLGELLYFRLAALEEYIARWGRQQAQVIEPDGKDLRSKLFWGVSRGLAALDRSVQTLKYTQLQPLLGFCDRYGLNLRWLLSAGGGVICVVLVAPSWSHTLFSLGNSMDQLLFQVAGHLSPAQVAQVQQAMDSQPLPPSQTIIQGFPEAWANLYLKDLPSGAEVALQTPQIPGDQ